MWYWTFEEVYKCRKKFEYVYVNTDDPILLKVARDRYGFIPIERRAELCLDDTLIADVMQAFCLEEKERLGTHSDYVTLLSPTNPLRTHKQIKAAIKIAEQSDAEAVVSIKESPPKEHHLHRVGGSVIMCDGSRASQRTQGFKQYYCLTGSIVCAKWGVWANKVDIYNSGLLKVHGIETGKWDIDIDTKIDLRIAEALLSWRIKRRAFFKRFMGR